MHDNKVNNNITHQIVVLNIVSLQDNKRMNECGTKKLIKSTEKMWDKARKEKRDLLPKKWIPEIDLGTNLLCKTEAAGALLLRRTFFAAHENNVREAWEEE